MSPVCFLVNVWLVTHLWYVIAHIFFLLQTFISLKDELEFYSKPYKPISLSFQLTSNVNPHWFVIQLILNLFWYKLPPNSIVQQAMILKSSLKGICDLSHRFNSWNRAATSSTTWQYNSSKEVYVTIILKCLWNSVFIVLRFL